RAIFGTHDSSLIRRIEDLARVAALSPQDLEFQMLYGIQREEQVRLAARGYRFRVLISYGDAWFPWYMRRLAERPANVLFVLRQANEDRTRENHATARDLYRQVYEKVPAFVHALRRQCQEELALGHRETAITLCRKAAGQQESSENLAALAMAIVTGAPKQT